MTNCSLPVRLDIPEEARKSWARTLLTYRKKATEVSSYTTLPYHTTLWLKKLLPSKDIYSMPKIAGYLITTGQLLENDSRWPYSPEYQAREIFGLCHPMDEAELLYRNLEPSQSDAGIINSLNLSQADTHSDINIIKVLYLHRYSLRAIGLALPKVPLYKINICINHLIVPRIGRQYTVGQTLSRIMFGELLYGK